MAGVFWGSFLRKFFGIKVLFIVFSRKSSFFGLKLLESQQNHPSQLKTEEYTEKCAQKEEEEENIIISTGSCIYCGHFMQCRCYTATHNKINSSMDDKTNASRIRRRAYKMKIYAMFYRRQNHFITSAFAGLCACLCVWAMPGAV